MGSEISVRAIPQDYPLAAADISESSVGGGGGGGGTHGVSASVSKRPRFEHEAGAGGGIGGGIGAGMGVALGALIASAAQSASIAEQQQQQPHTQQTINDSSGTFLGASGARSPQ